MKATAGIDTSSRLQSIQILRAFAALMVVWLHAIKSVSEGQVAWIRSLDPTPLDAHWFREGLGSGVDIFFVISGFIMVYGAGRYAEGREPPMDFLKRRLLRIYPPYWLATLLMILILGAISNGASPELGANRILSSFFLFPSMSPEGVVRPILGVGWTLSYEVYFYIVFFIALWLGRWNYGGLLLVLLAGFFLAAHMADSGQALARFLQDPIILEFLYGAMLGWLPRQRLMAPSLSLLTAALCILSLFLSSWLVAEGKIGEIWRFLYWGLPAAGIVLACLNLRFWDSVFTRSAVAIGDASYAIYLIHVPVIYFLMPLAAQPLFAAGLFRSAEALIALSLLMSIMAGLAYNRLPWPVIRSSAAKTNTTSH